MHRRCGHAGTMVDVLRSAAPGTRVVAVRLIVAARMARADLGRQDTALVAGGLTFYAAIAIVPLLLLTTRAASALTSSEWVVDRFADMAVLLPDTLGARAALSALVQAGIGLGPLGIVVALFPATFYGEGLRRALTQFTPVSERFLGWRGRVLVLPFVLLAPVLLSVLLAASAGLRQFTTDGGPGELALRVWLGFQCLWLVLAVPLGWVYGAIAPHRIRWQVLIVGSLVASSFIAGFVQGFVLFLAIPVDLGAPFGGLDVIGGGIAVALWMFLLHVLVLVGWVAIYSYDQVSATGDAERPSTERNR